MTALIVPIWMLFTALGGVIRILAPHRCLKGAESAPPLLRKIRLFGALRVAIALTVLWALGVSVSIAPAVRIESDTAIEKIVREKSAAFLKRRDTAGLAVAVVAGADDKVFHFGRAVTDDTLFEIGSITKVFTGIALAKAVQEGRVNLEDKAFSFCPEGFSLNDGAKEITLQHLATHTSGYPRMPGYFDPLNIANFILFGGDPYRGLDLESFRKMMATTKPENTPGKKMEYSNFGVSLLGWLLAKKAGTDYDTFIRAEVLDPLSMRESGVNLSLEDAPRLAQGYRRTVRIGRLAIRFRSAHWHLPDHLAAAGGIRSNGGDMLKFLRANMRPDDSAIGRAIKRSHAELFKINDERAMGMNWIIERKKDGADILWHNGGTGGFRSYLGFYADGAAGVVVLSNGAGDTDHLGSDLLRSLAALHAKTEPVGSARKGD